METIVKNTNLGVAGKHISTEFPNKLLYALHNTNKEKFRLFFCFLDFKFWQENGSKCPPKSVEVLETRAERKNKIATLPKRKI